MKRQLYLVLTCCALSGCDHPERKTYERHQGNTVPEVQEKYEPIETAATETIVATPPPPDEQANILQMETEGGVRYVWIEINGIRLRFIFDTGASSICISPAEASVLYRQGTLRKEDILDVTYLQDATGRISEGTKINLREVKIGNQVLENVTATVIDNVNAPLLMGQTVLERFGSIEIDNENGRIIFK